MHARRGRPKEGQKKKPTGSCGLRLYAVLAFECHDHLFLVHVEAEALVDHGLDLWYARVCVAGNTPDSCEANILGQAEAWAGGVVSRAAAPHPTCGSLQLAKDPV